MLSPEWGEGCRSLWTELPWWSSGYDAYPKCKRLGFDSPQDTEFFGLSEPTVTSRVYLLEELFPESQDISLMVRLHFKQFPDQTAHTIESKSDF